MLVILKIIITNLIILQQVSNSYAWIKHSILYLLPLCNSVYFKIVSYFRTKEQVHSKTFIYWTYGELESWGWGCGWVAVDMSRVGVWVKSSTCRTHLIPHFYFRHFCLSTFLLSALFRWFERIDILWSMVDVRSIVSRFVQCRTRSGVEAVKKWRIF